MKIKLLAYIGDKSGSRLLSQFLDHYYRLGVDDFLVILHTAYKDGPQKERAQKLFNQYDITPKMEVRDYSAKLRRLRFREIMDTCCLSDDWVIHADLDEFQVYPIKLRELLCYCDANGFNFVTGRLIDRIAKDGTLKNIENTPSLWEQFPYSSHLTNDISQGWDRKVCVMKGFIKTGERGAHCIDYGRMENLKSYKMTYEDKRGYPDSIAIHHFKWDHSLFHRIMQKMRGTGGDKDYELMRGSGFFDEYRRIVEYIATNDRLPIEQAQLTGIPQLHYERASVENI